MDNFKHASIIIPVYNEEDTISNCITSLLDGDYPVDKLEFVIVDGGSTDKTLRKVESFLLEKKALRIKILKNPYRTQGYGLNIGIENAHSSSEFIIRADAHGIYPRNYVVDCIRTLMSVDADNVGGVMLPVGTTPLQKAVAFCMSHLLGVGNAKFHLGNFRGFVDTVYLGCFKKAVFKKVGMFDPLITPNEDAELNLRIAKSGRKIYLNGDIQVKYFPRNSIWKLMTQYFKYGQGRCRTFKKHKTLTSVRQVIPPVWFLLTPFFIGMNFVSPLFIAPLVLYGITLFSSAFYGALKKKEASIMLAPLCLIVMHYAWAAGFLTELPKRHSATVPLINIAAKKVCGVD